MESYLLCTKIKTIHFQATTVITHTGAWVQRAVI